eukprot:366517-Chlamydomonas_euryale.AAC.14
MRAAPRCTAGQLSESQTTRRWPAGTQARCQGVMRLPTAVPALRMAAPALPRPRCRCWPRWWQRATSRRRRACRCHRRPPASASHVAASRDVAPAAACACAAAPLLALRPPPHKAVRCLGGCVACQPVCMAR